MEVWTVARILESLPEVEGQRVLIYGSLSSEFECSVIADAGKDIRAYASEKQLWVEWRPGQILPHMLKQRRYWVEGIVSKEVTGHFCGWTAGIYDTILLKKSPFS